MTSWSERLATNIAKATVDAINNSKGKGKGKGKNGKGQAAGNGKHTASGAKQSAASPMQQGQWLCLMKKCPWAEGDKPNHGFRKRC